MLHTCCQLNSNRIGTTLLPKAIDGIHLETSWAACMGLKRKLAAALEVAAILFPSIVEGKLRCTSILGESGRESINLPLAKCKPSDIIHGVNPEKIHASLVY